MSDQFDFEESELFQDGPTNPHQAAGGGGEGSDHEIDKFSDSADDVDSHRPPILEHGHVSGSAHSSTLREELDARIGSQGSEQEHLSRLRQQFARTAVPVRMGTSLPVAVPQLGKWRNDAMEEQEDLHVTSTFIPPHQLSQKDEFAFSLASSASNALKREKLRARNVILKKTGFLERDSELFNTVGLQERKRLSQGGLAQALALNSIVEQ